MCSLRKTPSTACFLDQWPFEAFIVQGSLSAEKSNQLTAIIVHTSSFAMIPCTCLYQPHPPYNQHHTSSFCV